MIAIGGAIGTGLFMGAGGRLHQAGPSLVLIYAICGFFGFLVLRAMGELVLHRPSSGSFVSYAREFYGEKAAFTAGWLYWLNWAMTSIAVVTLLGVMLNAVVPSMAFEIVLNVATLGILACWGTILLCHIKLFKWSKQGIVHRPTFRLFGAPYTSYLTLVFLAGVLVLIGFDYPIGTYTVASLTIIIPALIGGWFLCRDRVAAIAEQRRGFTGEFPVIAARPLAESHRPVLDAG